MARKAPSPQEAWSRTRHAEANRSYGNAARRGLASGRVSDITQAIDEFVAPGTDIWETLPSSPTDPAYGGAEPGTRGRFDLAVDAFEWADEFVSYDDAGFRYTNLAGATDEDGYTRPGEAVIPGFTSRDTSAAPITIVPTNTINPDRPRTVAAGYDRSRETVTVVFRDGTFYNYYEVTSREWQAFKMSRSKGRYIKKNLDQKPRGVADVLAVPVTVRSALYTVARVGQATGDERWQQGNLVSIHNARQSRQSRDR